MCSRWRSRCWSSTSRSRGSNDDEKLTTALDDLVPDVTAYFIAFAVIGLFWYGHHKAWSRLRRTTPRLVWSNLLLLSLIALMPFTTALMGGYGDQPISIVLYAANVGLAALADSHVDKVAFDEGLAVPASDAEWRAQLVTGRLRPAIFFASIPIAFLSPTLAQLSWLTLLLLPWVGRRLLGVRATRRSDVRRFAIDATSVGPITSPAALLGRRGIDQRRVLLSHAARAGRALIVVLAALTLTLALAGTAAAGKQGRSGKPKLALKTTDQAEADGVGKSSRDRLLPGTQAEADDAVAGGGPGRREDARRREPEARGSQGP